MVDTQYAILFRLSVKKQQKLELAIEACHHRLARTEALEKVVRELIKDCTIYYWLRNYKIVVIFVNITSQVSNHFPHNSHHDI